MSAQDIHVVVVGVSTAGLVIAKKVAALAQNGFKNLHVTIIDKNAYSYHAIGAPRAIVDKEYGKKLLFRLDTVLAQFEVDSTQPKHRFIQATLTNVHSDKTVVLSNGEQIKFDYLMLATGATNSFPANVHAPTLESARSQLANLHANVEQATSVLVIGGGAVGVEIAGEVADHYPSKKVTLVHSGERLLPLNFKESLSNGAVLKLQQLGVEVVLNERVDIPVDTQFDGSIQKLVLSGRSGRTYNSDMQFLATGTKLHTEYMGTLEKQLGVVLREKNGAIKVSPTLQLDTDAMPTVFVVGDVNSLPAGAKYAVKAVEQAQLAAANLITMIQAGVHNSGKTTSSSPVLQNWNGSIMNMIAVPIGKSLGVMQVMGLAFGKSYIGDFLVSKIKGKDYLIGKTAKEFPPGANA
ncbi:hypothetical protein GGF43_004971 [Coemansia sp. RSA 2618]|nr:hypothetical protein GGF43_004971 [Coemansia sp. RSA 2618]